MPSHFLSKKDLAKAAELGVFSRDATQEAASEMADYITGQRLQASTISRKLTEVRKLMTQASATKKALNATRRPEITIKAQKEHFERRNKLNRVVTVPRAFGTASLLLERLRKYAKDPAAAVKDAATILDLYVILSARVSELLPGGLSLHAKRRGRGIGPISVSGMLKKRQDGVRMPLVSVVSTAKDRAALLAVFKAFRALPDETQRRAVANVRQYLKHTHKLRLKDVRNIGAEITVATSDARTGLDRQRVRAGALRHVFDEAKMAATVAYDNVIVEPASAASASKDTEE